MTRYMTVLQNNMKLPATTGSFLIGLVICINLILCFIVLPYTQKEANRHMDPGPSFSFILYIIAAILIWICIIRIKRKNIYILAVLAISLIYWGYRLGSLDCLVCASGG